MIGDVFIQDGPRGLRFAAPTRVMIAMRPDEVIPTLQAVETAIDRTRDQFGKIGHVSPSCVNPLTSQNGIG